MTYEQRFLLRKSYDNGSKTPRPIVMLADYVSPDKRGSGSYSMMVKDPLPFEKLSRPEATQRPRAKKFERTIKYNHFSMNYTGWDK